MSLTVTKSDMIYRGRLVNFQVDTLKADSGKEFKREILVHPGAAVMIPCLDKERVILVRQYRHAAERNLLEFPAGTLEVGETMEECARRELKEEIGYEAGRWRAILSFYPSPGVSQEKMYLFLAEDLKLVDETPQEAAEIEIEIRAVKDLMRMVERGEIIDAKTIVGAYYLALRSTIKEDRKL